MWRALLHIFFLSVSLFAFGQKSDSLENLLSAATSDTARIRILNDLSRELKAEGEYKKSIEKANEALKLSERTADYFSIANSYNNIGQAFQSLSNHDTAYIIFRKAYELKDKFSDKKLEAQLINNIGFFYMVKGKREDALKYFNEALAIREKIKDTEGIAATYNNIGNLYVQGAENEKGLAYLKKSLFLREQLGDKKSIAASYHNIANTYYGMADYPRSMENYLKSLRLKRELNDKAGIGSTLNNLGAISRVEKDYKNAIAYFTESMLIRKEIGNKQGMSVAINNLGNIYQDMGDLVKARSYFEQSLSIRKEINDRKGSAIVLANLGSIDNLEGKYESALKYYMQALKIQEELKDNINTAVTYQNVGDVYLNMGNAAKAIEYGQRSIALTENTAAIMEQKLASSLLYRAYKKAGNVVKALKFHEKLLVLNDSIFNTEKNTKVNMLKTRFALDQQEAELKAQSRAEKEKLKAIAAAERSRQRTIIYSVVGGLVMLLLFSGFLFNRFQVIRKQKGIIETQKIIVEEKNRDITDSINYAKRIQSAILSPRDEIASKLADSFILYKPKDIVSGDFYYLEEKGDKVIIAVADCTGHGVPGAFMSLVGNNILDRVIKEKGITDPAEILKQLNEGVKASLHQASETSDSRDGMDIALCSFNRHTGELDYSGAMRNLYVVRKNGELEEIKSDKSSIGGIGDEEKSFVLHKLKVNQGDSFYLMSDGYADQFGGPNGKKFMTRRLKELLLQVRSLDMRLQLRELDEKIMSWKGDLEQVDDICVIGVKA